MIFGRGFAKFVSQTPNLKYSFLVGNRSLKQASLDYQSQLSIFVAKVPAKPQFLRWQWLSKKNFGGWWPAKSAA